MKTPTLLSRLAAKHEQLRQPVTITCTVCRKPSETATTRKTLKALRDAWSYDDVIICPPCRSFGWAAWPQFDLNY